jgi:outer membrane murein-binding lipoprotein Lpp
MKRSRSVLTVAAPLAAVLLLAGCGSSEEEERQAAFCDDVPTLLEDVTADMQAVTVEPQSAPDVVGDAVERLEAFDPPAGVADEWAGLVEAWAGMRDLLGRVDLENPEANTEFVEEATKLQEDLVTTGGAVDDWAQENC